MEKVHLELTEDEVEILSSLIEDYSDYMHIHFNEEMKTGNIMEYRGRELETLNAIRLRILRALEDSHDKR